MIPDKNTIDEKEIEFIKGIFNDILQKGEFYDVDDIESWFENEGSWKTKSVRTRITNLAHYAQSKHEQTAKLRMLNDKQDSHNDESCSCGS